jgi:DNA-binding protein HU-beta
MVFSRGGADISHGVHVVSGQVLTDFAHRCAAQSNLSLQLRFLEIVRFCCHKPGLKMTETELQIALAAATQTNKRTAGVFLDTLGNLAYKAIKKNGEFVLPGFGKLVKQKRKARTGFNPKTQQKIKIPAKTVVKFRVTKVAKDAILGVKK